MKKAIVATWLFKTNLSNLNAGEGSSNLKEIKSYNNGLPYISGQSVRHAIRKAIQRENKEAFKCTVEYPCGNIKDCWLCDIFGYMQPKGTKRWSPLKVTPAMGMIRKKITTDLILRLVQDIECPKCNKKINAFSSRKGNETDANENKNETKQQKDIKIGTKLTCPECKQEFTAPYDIRQAIAYKQLIENTYRVSVSIDIEALGIEEVPNIEGEGENAKLNGINYKNLYDNKNEDKKARVKAILNAISNISDFASISREMTNTTPDIIIISYQDEYNNRLASALELNEEGDLDIKRCKAVLEDISKIEKSQIYFGALPNTFNNQEKLEKYFIDKSKSKDNPEPKIVTPREAIKKLIAALG